MLKNLELSCFQFDILEINRIAVAPIACDNTPELWNIFIWNIFCDLVFVSFTNSTGIEPMSQDHES